MKKLRLLVIMSLVFVCFTGCGTQTKDADTDDKQKVEDNLDADDMLEEDILDVDTIYDEYMNDNSGKTIEDSGAYISDENISSNEYKEDDWQDGIEEVSESDILDENEMDDSKQDEMESEGE